MTTIKMEMVFHSTEGDADIYFVFIDDEPKFSIGVAKGDTKTPYIVMDAMRVHIEKHGMETPTILGEKT